MRPARRSAASVPLPAIPPFSPFATATAGRFARPVLDAQFTGGSIRGLAVNRGAMTLEAASADDLVAGEELGDFLGGGVGRVGAVHRILADRSRVHLANGAARSLGGIGRAHDIAILG